MNPSADPVESRATASRTGCSLAGHAREGALSWPPQLLQDFSLRMAHHGMSVSGALMMRDRRYALQQLKDAHNLADDALRLMAVQLFRHFEASQSGIGVVH